MSTVSMHNQRKVYGETLLAVGKENPNIVACDADLSKSTMSYMFGNSFPERFFEMGIAEANMISFAAGLSLTGKIPFVHSFAVFASGRPYDQIRVSVCLGRLNVKIIGSSTGLSDFGDGSTHQSVEDVSLMRSIPNMTVLSPVDGIEVEKMVRKMVEYNGPVYLRVNRNDLPDVFDENETFEIGRSYVVRDGNDAVIFATGVMISKALEAAEELGKDGVSVRVVNVSTLKPVDEEQLRTLSHGARVVVTAEEHSLIGGLASIVTYALRGLAIPIVPIGIQDSFGQSALSYDELLVHYGLTAENIKKSVKEAIK